MDSNPGPVSIILALLGIGERVHKRVYPRAHYTVKAGRTLAIGLYCGVNRPVGAKLNAATTDFRLVRRADWVILILVSVLLGIGLVGLRSIALSGAPSYFNRQILWALIGLCALLVGLIIDCERLGRYVGVIYGVNLCLLLIVAIAGNEAKGAVRWIGVGSFRFQPSEFSKLFIIVSLASLFNRRAGTTQHAAVFLRSLGHIALPVLLVLKQPDLGTAVSIIAVWVGISFIAGLPLRYHIIFAVAALGLFLIAWRIGFIHDYQIARLTACVNPDADPRGAGYQIRQARIAVGSGQLLGKGFGRGTQAHGRFIPERQTDFLFTVLAEEGGFVLCFGVIALYVWLLLRGWAIVGASREPMSRYVATGIVSMFSFHMAVNIGMTIGLLPVTGVPLPFMSYGGSSMIVSLAAVGLLVGISMRHERLVF